ncbi:acyltransferase family protein [Rhodanobacter ginsengisoli]|uniref:Acyltransferase family protein n=1 Tax=Rhodanobacter ginsengisoli TaxID=418646 RepID=A0ABW0QJC7_9GAMM
MAIRDLFDVVRPKGFYRPDIDGVRALAVLAVVAYHYSPGNFPGGFIGVDVFFVISGYLITGILVKAIEDNDFPTFRSLLSDFYQRRIRRIFPSLILVLTACLVIGWLVLFSSEYERLGKYVAAGAGYVENFVLWNEAGYFDHASIDKTLLHLWSLAVEEQFYIAWPLLLWVITRRRWPLLRSIALIAAMTFALNVSLVFGGHITHAFYSPVSRTWELMVGAWLAVAHRHGVTWLSRWSSVQAWGGMALIVAGLSLIEPTSAFPGFWALLPVLGTALIVNAGPNTFLNGRLLSWRPAVWVGLISYPLYLWHWVLLSLMVIVFGDNNPTFRHASRLVLVAVSTLLAWLSYRYFEDPIRRSRRGFTSVGLTAAVSILGVAGLAVYAASGVPDRPASLVSVKAEEYVKSMQLGALADSRDCFNPQTRMTLLQKRGRDAYLPDKWYCEIGDTHSKAVVLAYGDSHARAMIPTLDKYGKATNTRIVFSSIGSCLPLTDVIVRTDYPNACRELSEKVSHFANEARPKAVVLIEAWASYMGTGEIHIQHSSTGAQALRTALNETLGFYQNLGIPVVLMEDNPHQRTSVPKAAIRFAKNPSDKQLNASAVTRPRYEQQQAGANSILKSVASQYSLASVLGVGDALCNADICPWATQHEFLYYDSGHLSEAGSLQVYPVFAAHMNAISRHRP